MTWFKDLQKKYLPKHKYAINATLLGDLNELPWTNLGYWDKNTTSYPEACQNLAWHLVKDLNLKPQDHLIDVACGFGASLLLWQQQYQLENITALELQTSCINQIKHHFQQKIPIYCDSLLNLERLDFDQMFDVVVCIDAAYHIALENFLSSTTSILKPKGKLAFHYLMLNESTPNISLITHKKNQLLLQAADVKLHHVLDQQTLENKLIHSGLEHIQIKDISENVLAGFSHYIEQNKNISILEQYMDALKIRMTAKLCRKLYEDGLVRYVQITAQKK